MSSSDRGNLWLPLLGALALLAGWLAFKGFQAPTDLREELVEQRPRYHLEDARWRRYDDTGAPIFVLAAANIDYFDDASMQLDSVRFDTYAEAGRWQLEADRGHVPAGETRLKLQPLVDVHGVRAPDGSIDLQTPSLWVDWTERTLKTDDPVEARTAAGSTLEATGMRGDWTGRHVEFLDAVRVRHVLRD
ncbi:LPS export ABC transporter periplasmic protein LptC [Sinimarinibacterium flocculans]|uniref:LPS export ABC transporter protein LptC n=1 Tax=Sinimarinibacterium flocculans TaxID=985250 RepID=A0A318EJX2_9GAMM|nr:LPS export ABC transporter periplasmic protein LptC [Sinimarinibacterium flocculans]PXV69550.1 LPS export ABC transporter protein LptC [Sinimarinibacterium flocculans]